MKAIVFEKYGSPDVLHLKEIEKPVPKDNEVLIKVHAATVIVGDCELRSFTFPIWLWLPLRIFFGIRKPKRKILGQEVAGGIEAVGKEIKQFSKGDRVFATTGVLFGAYAEYVCLPGKYAMAIMPANMTYGEAAAVPTGALNALHFIRRGKIRSGEKVLINGAAGNIGCYAVQLAKSNGAEVTAVDSAGKLDMLRSIGADHVIDYMQVDFTKNGETYDVILDAVGKSPFPRSLKSLNKNGRYVLANPRLLQMVRGLWVSMTTSKNVIFEFAGYRTEDLVFLQELIEAGTIRSVIDRTYPLEQTADAHRYVDTGQKAGNVIITLEQVTET